MHLSAVIFIYIKLTVTVQFHFCCKTLNHFPSVFTLSASLCLGVLAVLHTGHCCTDTRVDLPTHFSPPGLPGSLRI